MNNTFNISLNQPFLFFLQFLDRTKKHLLRQVTAIRAAQKEL